MFRILMALGLSGVRKQKRLGLFVAMALLLALTPRCRHWNETRPSLSQARGHPERGKPYSNSQNRSSSHSNNTELAEQLAASIQTENPHFGHHPLVEENVSLPKSEKVPMRASSQSEMQTEDSIIGINILPEQPEVGRPLRIVATTRDTEIEHELILKTHSGKTIRCNRVESWGYSPKAYSIYISAPKAGTYEAVFRTKKARKVIERIEINVEQASQRASSDEEPVLSAWPVRRNWTPEMEDLFSAFVAKLFYVRPGSRKGWRPMHQATRDPFRNILYGVMGLNEDHPESETPVEMAPDCADGPYQIRAYFAWKLGLPIMFNRCARGNSKTGPRCMSTHSNLTKSQNHLTHPVERFNAFVGTYLSWRVHSGNGRTLPATETSDFYPIELDIENIRPGAVFVDAGGHLILVSQVNPQTPSTMGALYGVDSHPDKSVTHKRFGSGTFVFNHRVPTDGFKGFRPPVYNRNKLRFMSNKQINDTEGLPRFSAAQSKLDSREAFYATMMKTLNPIPLDPRDVMKMKIDVLHKAMLERVEAVQIGVEYMKRSGWKKMQMPKGPAIFQTTGPWEIYSTPARDMRCFLAIDDVMSFPASVKKNESVYLTIPGHSSEELITRLEEIRDRGLMDKSIEYVRSDGSKWSLTLQDIVDRQKELEMAYNPNDCPETRWAAPKDSEEFNTCSRKSPPDQRFIMKLSRHWFSTRRRPDQR